MDSFKNVPFGNSVFQIMNFTAGKETPQRRYRHCLLQLNQKMKALKECEYRRRRMDIDIREIEAKMASASGFDLERLVIDLEEKYYSLEAEIKLIEDAGIEVRAYQHVLKNLPEFTREEFEIAEPKYWEARLLGDAKKEMLSTGSVSVGTIASLEGAGVTIGKSPNGQLTYTTREDTSEHMKLLTEE